MTLYLKKLKKTVSTTRNKIFFKYWSPSNTNNDFKENINERISFPLNRKSVQGLRKGSFKIYFHEMEKLLLLERIFEELEQNGFY